MRATAAEAPPAQQIRIKLKSKHRVASNFLYLFLPCMISGLAMLRDDSTLTNYKCAGYEKENIGEAVEQVSAEQAGVTRSFFAGWACTWRCASNCVV